MSEPARILHTDTRFDVVLPAFERAQLREGKSPATVKIYRWALQDLVTFARANDVGDLVDVDRDLLERWQDQLLERKLKAHSRSSASSAVRALIRWAAERDIVDWRLERAVASVKVKKSKKRRIPAADLEKIISWLGPRRPHMSLVELRDRALFFYILVTAARINEALQAKRVDYVAPVVIQKGGSEKTLNTSTTVLDMVHDYLRARKDDSPWLWVKHGNNINASGDRLEASGVREACKRLALELQIAPFSPHCIRHTSATYLANAGVPPQAIAAHLGHANLQTVYDYIEIDGPMLRTITDQFEQLIGQSPRPLPHASRRGWRDYVG